MMQDWANYLEASLRSGQIPDKWFKKGRLS
jgi:hypothetical protein